MPMREDINPIGPTDRDEPDGYVQSLARGLAVIAAFDADSPSMTLSDVARRTDLSRAAARRFLLTLEHLGYVRSDGRFFCLTPQVMRLGFAYLSSLGLAEVAEPHLQAVSDRLGETTAVAVLDGDDIVYVARWANRRILSASINVGSRFPAYATSMGRVLLAGHDDATLDAYLRRARLAPLTEYTLTDPEELRLQLHKVRARGYALVDQELEIGLRSVAVPIHGPNGRVVASMNISAATLTPDGLVAPEMLGQLRAAARAIEADLREQSH